ncbi:MAG: FixH family protein, partial [Deltaproteobacteria bacterium]|nr:FixH family protein [Deltaproteobacteria bacterium]
SEEIEKIQGTEQAKTASEVSETKAMDQEPAVTQAPDPEELDYATSKLSANGKYKISYQSISGIIKTNRIHSWELTISDPDGQPVNDARVLLTGKMPEHGHGLPTHPEITRAGFYGLYRVDNMKFSMPGWWVISISVMANDVPDSVSFNLNIP